MAFDFNDKRLARRQWLQMGSSSLVGITLAELLKGRMLAQPPAAGGRKAKSVILVLLTGGAAQQDTFDRAYEQGLTLVPLRMYFKSGRAKVLMGICRGRKLHDKREKIKKATVDRDIARAMRRR